jgi:hypothetical protein
MPEALVSKSQSENQLETRRAIDNEERSAWQRSFWTAAAAGLFSALLVAFLVCQTPRAHTLGWPILLALCALYLACAVLAGLAAVWLATQRQWGRVGTLAPCLADAVLFAPALVLLLQQTSLLSLAVATLTGGALSAGARRGERTQALLHDWADSEAQLARRAMFSGEADAGLPPWSAVSASIVLYLAVVAAVQHWLGLSSCLMGIFGCLLVWRLMDRDMGNPPSSQRHSQQHQWNRPGLYATVVVAFLLTFIALLPAIRSAVRDRELLALQAWAQALQRPQVKQHVPPTDTSGYEDVILLPPPRKQPPLTPPPTQNSATPALKQTMVILFDGPYWYTRAAGLPPGPDAHVAHGTPLQVRVGTSDDAPIYMEAHQKLATPITLDCCRAIDVTVQSAAQGGAAAMQLVLSDNRFPEKPQMELPLLPISGTSGAPAVNTSGGRVQQTLRFTLPAPSSLHSFNELTVRLQTTAARQQEGARTQVVQFALVPR